MLNILSKIHYKQAYTAVTYLQHSYFLFVLWGIMDNTDQEANSCNFIKETV